MKTLCAALLSVLPSLSSACDAVVLHGLSYHSDRDLIRDVNEINPGLGCRMRLHGRLGHFYEVGFYENSFGDWSKYLVAHLGFDRSQHGYGWGAYSGLADGYDAMIGTAETDGIVGLIGLSNVQEHFTTRITASYDSTTGDAGFVVGASLTIGGW